MTAPATARAIVLAWLKDVDLPIHSTKDMALDGLSAAIAAALAEAGAQLPICTEHQREIAFCGTCLADHVRREEAPLLAFWRTRHDCDDLGNEHCGCLAALRASGAEGAE